MSSARETAERIISDGYGCAGLAACFRETCACADAIAAALAAEREACAKVADGYLGADVIAAAIRNRE